MLSGKPLNGDAPMHEKVASWCSIGAWWHENRWNEILFCASELPRLTMTICGSERCQICRRARR